MSQLHISNAAPLQTPNQSQPQNRAAETAKPAEQAAVALQAGDELQTYTVKKGDNLWNISGAKLGDPSQWPAIHKLNQDQIKNPDLIYPDQVLKLPIRAEKPAPAQPAEPVAAEPAPVAPAEPVTPPAPPVAAEPQPAAPVIKPAPAQPAPVQAEPQPKHSILNGVAKAAAIGGAVGAIGTVGTLATVTATLGAPLSNLGGYATAQVVAKKLSSMGLSVPQGPALTKMVSQVGGPKVATAGVAIGVGLLAAGAAAGGYYLYQKATQ